MTFAKTEKFDIDLREVADFAKVLSHPARLAILKYLASCNACFSGNITDIIPLSRTTVGQHLNELKRMGLIQGTINGSKVSYCLSNDKIKKHLLQLDSFLKSIDTPDICCE